MASEAGSTPFPPSGAGSNSTAAAVIAREDRIPIWSLSYLFIGIIGVGFLFTFFDIFVIKEIFMSTRAERRAEVVWEGNSDLERAKE